MGSTAEPERFGKVRPLGSKGSNPLQVLYRQVGLLIKFRCGRSVTASPRTGNVLTSTFDVSPSQVIRASGLVEAPRSSFLALSCHLFDIRHCYRTIEILLNVAVQLQDSKALRIAVLRAFSLFKVFNLSSYLT